MTESAAMNSTGGDAVPKVHPASREILLDDPLEMHGFEVPGDPELMLRLLVEEYARIGWGLDDVWRSHGDDELRRRVAEILARCSVIRVTTTETVPLSERLVQIELPV
jgi:hypothetical protein